jgi:cytochrome c oxidase subunit 2
LPGPPYVAVGESAAVRKSLIIQLVALGVVIGAAAFVVAFYIPWLPKVGSREGQRIDDTYFLASVICLVIFAFVASVSIYAVIKFRAKPDDDEDGEPIHGHTGLEILWTAVPAALVTAIAIYTAVALTRNEDLAAANHRVIEVKAVQFAWSFTYPELGVTTGILRVPEGEQIELRMESDDVIHSFWVPEWRVKQDVVPGTVQRYIVTPTRTGTFRIICTELCGLGHAVMRSTVQVLSPADFEKWVAEQKGAAATGGADLGKQIFDNQGCGSCHTLAAAGATGQVGPDLDKVLGSLDAEFIRQSIADPNAVVTEGYQPDVMPKTYGEQLSGEQLDALVEYLVKSTTG